jgi:Arc/MetJ-type ribon-helix-helix transcriptional regulator
MQQKDRVATLTATVQAERDAKRGQVPRYDRFAKADAALSPLVASKDVDASENAVPEQRPHPLVDAGASRVDIGEDPSLPEVRSLKVIRETFSLPPNDAELIGQLREKCLTVGIYISKSELIRAGLHALQALSIENLRSTVLSVEKLPVGRAAKGYNRTNRSESINDT